MFESYIKHILLFFNLAIKAAIPHGGFQPVSLDLEWKLIILSQLWN